MRADRAHVDLERGTPLPPLPQHTQQGDSQLLYDVRVVAASVVSSALSEGSNQNCRSKKAGHHGNGMLLMRRRQSSVRYVYLTRAISGI